VQVAATFRSQPPIIFSVTNPTVFVGIQPTAPAATPTDANWNVPNTVVQSILGRLPPGGLANGSTNVPLLDNRNMIYAGDGRRNQVDMRFAKVFRFSGRRFDVGLEPPQHELRHRLRVAIRLCGGKRRDVVEPDDHPGSTVRARQSDVQLLTGGDGSSRSREETKNTKIL
jgi:hypothetical protein